MSRSTFSQHNQDASSAQDSAWLKHKERGSLFGLKLMTWIALHLGRAVSRCILLPVVAYFFISTPNARQASKQYLSKVAGQSSSWLSVYRHLYTFACVTLDRIYFLNGRLEAFDIQIEDADNLALETAASGVGLILMGAHLGSFESVRSIARQYPELKMILLMYEENAQNIKQSLKAINPDVDQAIISLGRPGVMLQVKEQLSEGALVGILGDRSLDDGGNSQVNFLQQIASFPIGPFRMAAMLKHPVYFMAGIYKGANQYSIHLEKIMDFSESNLDREMATQAALNKYVQLIEKHCLAHPYNWFNFYNFWQDSDEIT